MLKGLVGLEIIKLKTNTLWLVTSSWCSGTLKKRAITVTLSSVARVTAHYEM